LDRLDVLVHTQMAQLRQRVDSDLRRRSPDVQASHATAAARGLSAAIVDMTDAIDSEERRLMSRRAERARLEAASSVSIILLAVAVTSVLAIAVIRTDGARTNEVRRRNQRLAEEINRREEVQAQLSQAQKMEAVGQLTGA
jgi:hypothetical protein